MAEPIADIHAIIRRGKRRDFLFAVLGAILIFASLGILGILIADLVHDGAPQLVHTHDVKENGYAPSFLTDLTGTLRKGTAADGAEPAWVFEPDPVKLELSGIARDRGVSPEQAADEVGKLTAQRVVVEGLPADAGEAVLVPNKIAPLPADSPEGQPGARLARTAMIGALERVGDDELSFKPEPLVLDVSQSATTPQPYEGKRVAVTRKPALRREVGKLAVTDISSLTRRSFLNSMPASSWYQAGIKAAIIGTLLVMVVTLLTALPLGVAAGIYLEEYGKRNWFTALIEVNIANLAGVPSIIWGLLGLGLFVYLFKLGESIRTAGLTLGLLVLPIVIIATREAIRSVPMTIRDASFALGATKWQTVWNHVLPYSMSGILTGSIVALSRAIGETAPLIVIGAVVFIDFLPPPPIEYKVPDAPAALASADDGSAAADGNGAATVAAPATEKELHVQPFAWLRSQFTVLPIQMFNWTGRPEREFHKNAAAAGLVLIVMTLSLNSLAIYLRARLRKRIKW